MRSGEREYSSATVARWEERRVWWTPDWPYPQMYSEEANEAVHRMIRKLVLLIDNGVTRQAAVAFVQMEVAEITRRHGEVHDTEPEWWIHDAVASVFGRSGWLPISRDTLAQVRAV